MNNSKLNLIDRILLKYIFKKNVKQSHDHEYQITEIYGLLREAVQKEFTEDTIDSNDAFLKDCFQESIDKEFRV